MGDWAMFSGHLNRYKLIFGLLLLALGPASTVLADNVGGAFGPVVNPDHRSWQYRAALDPDTDDFAHRLHYQHALDDDFMWRLIVQGRAPGGSNHGFDYFGAELFWQLPNVRDNWQQGVRFDLRFRDDDRPQSIGFNWMHQIALNEVWRARGLLLLGTDFGENRRDSVGIQTRFQLLHRTTDTLSLGAELYSGYGRADDLQGLDDQTHQIGPIFSWSVAPGWSVFGGPLFGLTDPTDDYNIRLWLTYSL